MSLGFYFDMSRCVGCRVCQIACKDRMALEQAGPRTRRVTTFETGDYPDASVYTLSIGCNHCEHPACVANCPTGAMYKDATGVVLHDDDRCIACRACVMACPYGAPQYLEDARLLVKCDSCKALRDAGENPVCVDACGMRALEFGDVDELRAAHGEELVSELPCLGSAAMTVPNLLVNAPRRAFDADFVEAIV